MSTTLSMTWKARVEWLLQAVDADLGNAVDRNFAPSDPDNYQRDLANGTGNNQLNQLFTDVRTVTLASPTDDLDLSGVLTNRYGETITFREIKLIMIVNLGVSDSGTRVETDGEDLLIGGAGAAGAAFASFLNGNQDTKLRIRTGGMLYLTAPNDGYSVSPGVQDVLRVAHDGSAASGGDIDYLVAIAGVQ